MIESFRAGVSDAELADLRDRLLRTRWPEPATVDGWSQGVPLSYARDLCDYWARDYDWRRTESRLNSYPQFRTNIDGLGIHFLHVQSPHADALPLILSHGWPGSMMEFLATIEPLTNPPDPADAFDLVIPSLPGYGFSDKPTGTGWGVQRIARAWAELMARLGYSRYGAAGGDWGTSITTSLGQQDAEHLAGIHLMPPIAAPDPATFDDLTAGEAAALDDLRAAQASSDGYSLEQSTKPQTIGYGLVDSPAALATWIAEKFQAWTDPESMLTRDNILDNITLYWLTGSGASAARLYWESFAQVQAWFTEATVDTVSVPAGCSVFPKELPRPSRRWAAKRYTDIRHWNQPPRGGHFAALEQPELFATELRSFFRLVG